MDKKQTREETFLQKRNERMIIDDFDRNKDRTNEVNKLFEEIITKLFENRGRKLFILKYKKNNFLFANTVCTCKRVNVKVLNDTRKGEKMIPIFHGFHDRWWNNTRYTIRKSEIGWY